jgi:hypothetical protein
LYALFSANEVKHKGYASKDKDKQSAGNAFLHPFEKREAGTKKRNG